MKTSPQYLRNLFFKFLLGTVILCPISFANELPLKVPEQTAYPGIIEVFEKLIQVDNEKIKILFDTLEKNGSILGNGNELSNVRFDPDFINSLILHSHPGYLKLSSRSACSFYDTLITDLLKFDKGKITNIPIIFNENGLIKRSLISKKDFLNRVVTPQCPETVKNISDFQVKNLGETLKSVSFEVPQNRDHCQRILRSWVSKSQTPFLCQIHEFIQETKNTYPNDKSRNALSKVLEAQFTPFQKDYLEKLCLYLDEEELFCEHFNNTSFWNKISTGLESSYYAENICNQKNLKKTTQNPEFDNCLNKLNYENDFCLYPQNSYSLIPSPDCDQLSISLNHSTYKQQDNDCSSLSDQLVVTNFSRIIGKFEDGQTKPKTNLCHAFSAERVFRWNQALEQDENWKIEACYNDRLLDREVCNKTLFTDSTNLRESYTNVVSDILKKTRGATESLKCKMISADSFNPLLLEFKSGCWIITETKNCGISDCRHKILYNDRPIDFITIKGSAKLDYYPLSVKEERSSQNYLLNIDYKKNGRTITTLNSLTQFLKKHPQGIIHGVGCAEDLLPSFFEAHSFNQCSGLPFIITGRIHENESDSFVIYTAIDNLRAPRIIGWSPLFSSVKKFQRSHPLKSWPLYGID